MKQNNLVSHIFLLILFLSKCISQLSPCQMTIIPHKTNDNTYVYISNQFNTILRLAFNLFPAYQSYSEYLEDNCTWSFKSGATDSIIPSSYYCYPKRNRLICYFKIKSAFLSQAMPLFLYSNDDFIKAFQPIQYHSNYALETVSVNMKLPYVSYRILFKSFGRRDQEEKHARLKVMSKHGEFEYVFGKIAYESFMQDGMKMPFGMFLLEGLIREVKVINYMNHEDYRFNMGRIFDINKNYDAVPKANYINSESETVSENRYEYNPITIFKPIDDGNTFNNNTIVDSVENYITSINALSIFDRPIHLLFKEIIWKQSHSKISFNITTFKPLNYLSTSISITTYDHSTICTSITSLLATTNLITCYPKRIPSFINSPCNITITIPPMEYTFKCLIQQEIPTITECILSLDYSMITCDYTSIDNDILLTNETLRLNYNNIPLNYTTIINKTRSSIAITLTEAIGDIGDNDLINLELYLYSKAFKIRKRKITHEEASKEEDSSANNDVHKTRLEIIRKIREEYGLHEAIMMNRLEGKGYYGNIPKEFLPNDYLISITNSISKLDYYYGKDIITQLRFNLLKSRLDKSMRLIPSISNSSSSLPNPPSPPSIPSLPLPPSSIPSQESLGKFLPLSNILYIDNDIVNLDIFSYKKSFHLLFNQSLPYTFYVQSESLATDQLPLTRYYLQGTQFNLMVLFLSQYHLKPSVYHLIYQGALFKHHLATFEVKEVEMTSSIYSLEYSKIDAKVIVNGMVSQEDYHHFLCLIRVDKGEMAYLVKMRSEDDGMGYYCEVYGEDYLREVVLFIEFKGHLRLIKSKRFSIMKSSAINEAYQGDYERRLSISDSDDNDDDDSKEIRKYDDSMKYVVNYTISQCDSDENLLEILNAKLLTFLSSYTLSSNDLSQGSILVINNNIINFEFISLTNTIPYYCLINNKHILHALPSPSITPNHPLLSCNINPILPQLLSSSSSASICLYNSNPTIIPSIINLLHCKQLLLHPIASLLISNISFNPSTSSIQFTSSKSIIFKAPHTLYCLIENQAQAFMSVIQCTQGDQFLCTCDYGAVMNGLPLTSFKWFLSVITRDVVVNPIRIPLRFIKMYAVRRNIRLVPEYVIRNLKVQNVTLEYTAIGGNDDVFFDDDITNMQKLSACKITTNIKSYISRIVYSSPHPKPNIINCFLSILFNTNEDTFTIAYVYDYSPLQQKWSYENEVLGSFPIFSYPSISSNVLMLDYSMTYVDITGQDFLMSPPATLGSLTYHLYIEVFLFPCNVLSNNILRCTLTSSYFYDSHPLITSGSLTIMESKYVYPSMKMIIFPIVNDITMRFSKGLVSSIGGTVITINFSSQSDNNDLSIRSSYAILHHMLKYNKHIKIYYHNLPNAEEDVHYDKLTNQFYFTTPDIDSILQSSNINFLHSHLYIYFLRVDHVISNPLSNISTQRLAVITLKNISLKRYFSMTMNLKQTVQIVNLINPSNSLRFIIQHKDIPSLLYSTKQYITTGDQYEIYWDLTEYLYIGEYCIGIEINDSEGVMYCEADNDITIYALPVLENMICFKSYQIIALEPSVIFQGGWFKVYHYPTTALPKTVIYHLNPGDISLNCFFDYRTSKEVLRCDIPSTLSFGEYSFSFMQENIKGTVKTITMISNSIKLLIISKPVIQSIDSFSFANDDQKYFRVLVDANVINQGIKCRLTMYHLASSSIHDPYKKYNEDLLGIYYDPQTILCKKNKEIIAGESLLCLMLTYNNFHEYVSSCGYDYTIISKYYKVIDYEPKAIPVVFSNSRLMRFTLSKPLSTPKRIQCLFEYLEEYFIMEANIDSALNQVLICKVPLMKYELSHSDELRVKIVIDKHINRDNDVIVMIKPLLVIDHVSPLEMSNQGGMKMMLYARNVLGNGTYRCRFDMIRTGNAGNVVYEVNAVIIQGEGLYCITPDTTAMFGIGDAFIRGELVVSEIDGRYDHHNHFDIEAYLPIDILSTSPSNSYIDRRMYILVKGINFRNKAGLSACFSLTPTDTIHCVNTKPIFIDSSTLIISTPTIFEYPPNAFDIYPIILHLSITNNGNEYSPTALPITFYTHPILISIQPTATYHPGNILTITGRHFNSLITHCLFAESFQSIAIIVSPSIIICDIPNIFAGKETRVPISLMSKSTYSTEVFNRNVLHFTFLNLILLRQEDINPNHGPYSGNILVTITKDIKIDVTSPLFQVLFGSAYGTNIQRIDDYTFTVIAPAKAGNQNVLIKLIYNGKQINFSTAFFYYIDYQVTNIKHTPPLGTYKGGTLLSISNDSEFLNNIKYQCLFIANSDSVSVDAFLIDSYHLGCITPQHAAGVLRLEINFDDYFITNLDLSYEFYLQIQLITFTPFVIYSYSQCLLNLFAYNIIYNPLLMVKIGNYEIDYSKVTMITNREYTVELPQTLPPGEYDISISNINQNFEVFKIQRLIIIKTLPSFIESIVPYIIPFNTKGTIMIKGKGFSYSHYYQSDLLVKINSIDYKTKYINDTLLTLDYPHQILPNSGDIEEFPLSFSYNKCLYLFAHDKLIMYHDFTNAKFKPHFIQSFTEEMIIVSIGVNLLNVKELSCRLSLLPDAPSNSHLSTLTIQGIYINKNNYGCVIPMIHFGFYDVVFSQNGRDFIKATDYLHNHIHIIKNVKMITLHPKIIPPGYQGMITIVGNNFVKYAMINCQYKINVLKTRRLNSQQGLDGIYNEETVIANAYYLNQRVLLCEYPTGRLLGNSVYDITIKLAEGAIYAYESVSLFIYQSPPNGYYIDNATNTIRRCDKGSHCSTYATFGNQNEVQCPYGYYQPFEGRSSCIVCPEGFLCNSIGMTHPMKCSAGFLCLQSPNQMVECPKGYYCTNEETRSYYVSRHEHMIEAIAVCPVGTYCNGGVRIGSSVVDDYTTPQLCSVGHMCVSGSESPMGIGLCLSGHYCPNAKEGGIQCPYRSECSNRGNIKPRLCEVGYYGDRKGLHKCIECPMGFICPKKGMLKPEPCPSGYICDKRALRYPYNYCKPGTVCFQGIKFELNEKLCFYTRNCDESNRDYVVSPMTSNEYLKNILGYDENFHLFLCCYSHGKWRELLTAIDQHFTTFHAFKQVKLNPNTYTQLTTMSSPTYSISKYLGVLDNNFIDGYELTIAYLNGLLPQYINALHILIPFQRDYLLTLLSAMYSNVYMFTPSPCPRKYYCLEGMADTKEVTWWSFTPRLCLVGYYCAGGAKYMSGTGPCPTGYHCEAGTDLPSLNPSSDVVETGCYPGTFVTSESVYSTCLSCPDGYECTEQGTYWPTICMEGFFRTIYDSCISCPKGTYSYEKGQKDSSQCVPCPAGKLCTSTSLNDPKLIKPCDEGTVCDIGSGLLPSYLCPSGYYCPTGTSPSTQYNFKCPEGYTCNKGTGSTNKSSQKCPIDYYCPPGTQSTISLIPSCPIGTTTNDTQGLTSLLQCHTAKEHDLFTTSPLRILFNDNQNFIIDPGLPITDDILSYYNILNDYDIVTLELLKYSTASQPPSSINSDRIPLVSFSPFMLNKGLSPSHTITQYYPDIIPLPFNTHYYHLTKNSYAYITFDFRHLASPEHFFIYGIDWDITFKKQFSLSQGQSSIPLQVPELFLSKNNTKTKVHEFIVYTLEDIYLSVDVNIYNSLFAVYSTFFNESAYIEQVKPNRAELNTDKFFGIIWDRNEKVTLPVNLPLMNNTLETVYDTINEKMEMNFAGYASSNLSIVNQIVFGINYYQPQSQYWGNGESLGMVYIPYISNCKGYGRYLPLWALLEQSKSCKLIPEEETVFIEDFSFGVQAIGDNCTISLECIYDEDISKPSALGYWFEEKTGEKMFSITQNPINLNDLLLPDKNLELISVEVQSEIEYENIPTEITLNINYFQQSKTVKKIIDAQMVFSKPIPKSSITQGENVHYTFKINYEPYSHTKLMVAFALSSKFYMVLYLIEGVITSFMVLTFFFYHRLMSRIDPRPIFKFFSFFPLIIPPVVIGWALAVIPLLFIVFIIGIILTGKIFFTTVVLFNYVSPNGITYYSIFDFFEYNCSTSIEMREIRNGRFGVSIIALGIFLIYYHTQVVVPNEKTTHKTSYDSNLWHFINWKRMIVYYIDIFLIVVNVYYTMLSFSSVWSDYIWYFIYSYKLLGILLENLFEEVFQEQLLISGFPCLFNIVQALLTFGAPTLIDFLNSAFIEQGGALVEKVYIESFTNYVKEHQDEYVEKIKKWIKKVLKYDLELESETKAQVDDDEEDDAIILSDDDDDEADGENGNGNANGNGKGNNRKENKELQLDSENGNGNDVDDNDSNSQLSDDLKRKGKNKAKTNPNAIEIEEFFDRYKGFGSDCLSYFINIAFYLVLWIYYEEAHILENYDISKDNFIYFYYFIIITVPFCIVNDIILHNLMEEYANIQMHDFLDYVQYRYYIRNTSWALDDEVINFEVEFSIRKMYKLCFSSQYYYLKVHYIAGLLCLITGVTGVMLNNINPFGDPATIFIFILVFVIVKLVKGLCRLFARWIRLWQIETSDDHCNTINNKETIASALNLKTKTPIPTQPINYAPIVSVKNWEKIKFLNEQKELLDENLRTERLLSERTRKNFVNSNKIWLQNVITDIITPRSLIQNKQMIIEVLKKKYKAKEPNVDLDSINFYESKQIEEEESYESKEFQRGFKEKFEEKISFKEILGIWRKRSQLGIVLFSQVKLLVMNMIGDKCDECGLNVGLSAVYKGDLIRFFYRFLEESKQDFYEYEVIDFKQYFKANAEIVTLCSNCI